MSQFDSLPVSWACAPLSEVTKSMGGGTPDTRDPRFWVDGSIPWVSPKDMKTFEIGQSIDCVSTDALVRLTLVPKESVLIVVRSGILSRVLPVAVNTVPVTINQDMRAFVPNAGVEARFLAWQLLSRGNDILTSCAKDGTTVASIEGSRLASFEVSIAPSAEQQRIVDLIEKLTSHHEVAVAEVEAAQRKLTRYRQSLLKSAVEGTLTAEWRAQNPAQETGAELLVRILRERRARWEARQLEKFAAQGKAPPKGWQSNYAEPAAPGAWSIGALPTTWTHSTIGQCFHVAVGATPSRKVSEFWGEGVPWVSSGEVRFARISATRESITESGLNNSSTQINPVGSVLLGMIGEGKTRGQVAILDIEAANNQNCAALWVPETEIPPEFVYYWLWSRYDETRRGSSGNNQPALNKTLIAAMPLPLPPLAEAREIVSRVCVQLDGIEAQEREIAHLLRLAAAQRQNILRAAFSGRLVPQDPTDEPAGVLLARIRAGRDSAPKVRAARKKALSSRPCNPAEGPATC